MQEVIRDKATGQALEVIMLYGEVMVIFYGDSTGVKIGRRHSVSGITVPERVPEKDWLKMEKAAGKIFFKRQSKPGRDKPLSPEVMVEIYWRALELDQLFDSLNGLAPQPHPDQAAQLCLKEVAAAINRAAGQASLEAQAQEIFELLDDWLNAIKQADQANRWLARHVNDKAKNLVWALSHFRNRLRKSRGHGPEELDRLIADLHEINRAALDKIQANAAADPEMPARYSEANAP